MCSGMSDCATPCMITCNDPLSMEYCRPENWSGLPFSSSKSGESYLTPDIRRKAFRVKRALGSITTNKARGGDKIPVELFQILKDDAVKVLHPICQQIWKTQHDHRTGKGQFSFRSQEGNAKDCSDYCITALISHASKACSKFSKPGFGNM